METGINDKSKVIARTLKKRQTNGKQFFLQFPAEDAVQDYPVSGQFKTDFDLMMMRKRKNYIQRRTSRRNVDIINKNDDRIAEFLETMRDAADQDRQLNLASKPAIKKIAFLKQAVSQLVKKDLQIPFLEHNMLNVLAEWISPLPSKALPCLQIRESILKLLGEFSPIDKSYLKQSGIGKAVMYLYRHPDETSGNRKRAEYLINCWFRTINNVNTELKAMSCEERRQLELKQVPIVCKLKEKSLSTSNNQQEENLWLAEEGKETSLHPGDKDWIGRARVPMPSEKAYIVRPKSKVEIDVGPAPKKQMNRYEKHMKNYYDLKRRSMVRPLVNLYNGGRNLDG
uniref:TFIIS N-terminal domain-containing protein n=1 Tax=Anopheles christyi TaxID=43041 RepID=A0A182KHV2_9DIPT